MNEWSIHLERMVVFFFLIIWSLHFIAELKTQHAVLKMRQNNRKKKSESKVIIFWTYMYFPCLLNSAPKISTTKILH